MIYFVFIILLLLALFIVLLPVWKGDAIKAQKQRFVLIVAVAFFAIGFGLYFILGAPEMIPLMQERQEKMKALAESISALSSEVKAHPDKLSAWVELGTDYMQANQYAPAANAFKRAVILSKGHPDIIMAYAEALIAVDDGKVSDHAKESLDMVVLQDPKNAEARYWLIVRSLQEGHQEEAMKNMKALYHSLPEDSPVRKMIDKQIGKN